MSYCQLMDNGSDRTTIQTYLAQGDMLTTIIRIPHSLKDAVSGEVLLSGMTVSAYIRQCATNHLVGQAGESR